MKKAKQQDYDNETLLQITKALIENVKFHTRLLRVVGNRKIIRASINELAKKMKINRYIVYFYLSSLREMGFVSFPKIENFRQTLTIKIKIRY